MKHKFTLIELLVSAACKVRVLPLYYLKKENKKMPYYHFLTVKKFVFFVCFPQTRPNF